MIFGSPFMGRNPSKSCVGGGGERLGKHNARTAPRDADSLSFSSCFYWEFLRMRRRSVRSGLLGGGQHALGRANIVRSLLADLAAHGFAAFSAVYRRIVMAVHLRRGASARRDGVVHFRRIETPTHADDHENDLQRFATDCQSPCNSHARRRGVALSCRSRKGRAGGGSQTRRPIPLNPKTPNPTQSTH